ncbi:HTH-type transcriptional activator RhaR [bioreactor metagenome]|uniref:HTH-type transcriptional activator RhaR n=1 Tax=bioreactor metagenome TaxID=1076179 RepID=A0A645J0D7_9ZZZZ
MKRAKMLLRRTDEKVAAVAGRLGFEDAEYFSRLFKLYYTVTPTEYRRNAARPVNEAPMKQRFAR